MVLENKVIPIILDKGLEAGKDPKVTAGPIRLDNAVFDRIGAVSKREGVKVVEATSNHSLGKFKDRLCTLGDTLDVFPGGSDIVGAFDTVDNIDIFDVQNKELESSISHILMYPEMVEKGNYLVASYTQLGVDCYAKSYNRHSGVLLDTKIMYSSASHGAAATANARSVVHNDTIYTFYLDPGGILKYFYLYSDGTFSGIFTVDGAGILAADTADFQMLDVVSQGGIVVMVYPSVAGNVAIVSFVGTGGAGHSILTSAIACFTAFKGCGCFIFDDFTICVLWKDGDVTRAAGMTNLLAETISDTIIDDRAVDVY